MYNDYPVVHESFVINWPFIILITTLCILVYLFIGLVLGKIFKRAEKKFVSGFIPFYNIYVLLEICDLPRYNIVLFFIPIINIYTFVKLASSLTSEFGKQKDFKYKLFFLPFIYYPQLAFSKDKYIGINNEKVKEIYLDEKIIEEVESREVKVVRKDQNINMGSNIKEEVQENKDEQVSELKANTTVLDKSRSQVNMDYVECPKCHNKVKKGVAVCFFCGENLRNLENQQNV